MPVGLAAGAPPARVVVVVSGKGTGDGSAASAKSANSKGSVSEA